ncbi:MAG: hypothetical protein M3P96_10830 [Actinomycetota bacterium]|nr:hypothetical protein [Actinomycetota bacterium]
MVEAFYALAVLACPVGMGAMMWFMMRAGKQPAQPVPAAPSARMSAGDAELVALRTEVDQLRAEQRERRGVPVRPAGVDPSERPVTER